MFKQGLKIFEEEMHTTFLVVPASPLSVWCLFRLSRCHKKTAALACSGGLQGGARCVDPKWINQRGEEARPGWELQQSRHAPAAQACCSNVFFFDRVWPKSCSETCKAWVSRSQ